uniref:YqaJ viral recombinase domain-containing protein n=1 Tax=Clytia hemisphaerica TaxID=252671 RepID=A0A7M5XHH3_9CNID
MFKENLTKDMTPEPEIIQKIESATKGQSTNKLWFQHRKGVITASKAHEVKTKMKTIESYPNGSEKSDVLMWSLTKKVAGFSFVNPNIPALKYDRNMEPLAASNFLELMKTKHKGAKLVECGLFLDKEKPYIGASPDGVFFCDCCCEKSVWRLNAHKSFITD